MAGVKERIVQDELLFDNAIVSHGYAPHLRDYHVLVEVPDRALPVPVHARPRGPRHDLG